MDDERDRHGAPLLVRRGSVSALDHVLLLLRERGVAPDTIEARLRAGTVLVLSDVTLPPDAPPLAAAAVRLGRDEAELEAIGVVRALRRQGLGRRLMTGTFTLLRARGVRRVSAVAAVGTAAAGLLTAVGFEADPGLTADRQRWTKWL